MAAHLREDTPLLDEEDDGDELQSLKGRWTPEEDEALRNAVLEHKGKNWKVIAAHLPLRTDVQCLHRWQKVLRPGLVKGPWTKQEDELVKELVAKHGVKRWSLIAQHLQGRLGKQCRERWYNHLNPDINKTGWSSEEDIIIVELHNEIGNKWAEIARKLPGRTDNSIKNRWNSTLRRLLNQATAQLETEGPDFSKCSVTERNRRALEYLKQSGQLGEGSRRRRTSRSRTKKDGTVVGVVGKATKASADKGGNTTTAKRGKAEKPTASAAKKAAQSKATKNGNNSSVDEEDEEDIDIEDDEDDGEDSEDEEEEDDDLLNTSETSNGHEPDPNASLSGASRPLTTHPGLAQFGTSLHDISVHTMPGTPGWGQADNFLLMSPPPSAMGTRVTPLTFDNHHSLSPGPAFTPGFMPFSPSLMPPSASFSGIAKQDSDIARELLNLATPSTCRREGDSSTIGPAPPSISAIVAPEDGGSRAMRQLLYNSPTSPTATAAQALQEMATPRTASAAAAQTAGLSPYQAGSPMASTPSILRRQRTGASPAPAQKRRVDLAQSPAKRVRTD